MTDFGITPTGFRRKRFEDILASIGDRQKEKIAATLKTDDEKSVLGNLNRIASDELSQVWEVLEILANSLDPDNAIDYMLAALAALTGVKQRGPQAGSVTCTLGMGVNFDFLPGALVASVDGQADNLWTNVDHITGFSGTVTGVRFKSLTLGSKATALSGTLTVVAQAVPGWISITNPADAVPGKDAETLEELRIRRDESLAAQGSATLAAVVADLQSLDGVTAVRGEENTSDFVSGALLPHSIGITVYAPTLTDDAIGQAIYSSTAGGIATSGSTTVNVTDVNGALKPISFTRATEKNVTIAAIVESANGFNLASAKDAILAVAPTKIAGHVVIAKIISALIGVEGITDVFTVTLTIDGTPQTTNYLTATSAIALFSAGSISVTT